MVKEVFSSELPIDERLAIKKKTIKGGNSKKRFCVVTGTHGDELEGQYVCFLLSKFLQEHIEDLDGEIDIYPALNPLGIDSITRGIPNFDLDMNRIFPGDSNGAMAEVAANAIYNDLLGAEMVIDIHASNIFLREIPQVRINVNCADLLVPYGKELNVDFIWIHEAATVLESTLAHSLNTSGTPCLVVEMGVGMRITRNYGVNLVQGILQLLKALDFYRGEVEIENKEQIVSTEGDVYFLNANHSGVFIPSIDNNKWMKKGEEIGKIVSALEGTVLEDVVSPCDGLVFTLRAYPIVYEGSLMARVFKKK
ncbi:MAG: M14 family metallopeptidase [Paludibacteraceae bacterium]|nr:M14 family metallopeptidase [Paludibacteraceae bacterium]